MIKTMSKVSYACGYIFLLIIIAVINDGIWWLLFMEWTYIFIRISMILQLTGYK